MDYGLDSEDNIGLNLEDRKCRRRGPESKGVMDTDDNIKALEFNNTRLRTDADLSKSDCSTSSKQDF